MKIQEVDLKLIEGNPYQTRKEYDENSLKILIKSIRENGLINPINVLKQKDKFCIMSGHRRFECYKKMRRKTIPCIIRTGKANLKTNMAHENLMRDNLQPLEKANTIKLLIADKIKTTHNDTRRMIQLVSKLKSYKQRGDFEFKKIQGFDENDIFRMDNVLKSLGLSENNVVVYLSILSLPKKIQNEISWRKAQFVEESKIKIGHAEQLSRVKNSEYQNYLFEKCLKNKLTRERLRALVNNHIKEVESGEFKGIYKSSQVGSLKDDTKRLEDMQNEIIKISKKINSFKATTLLKLNETLEKQEFVSDVGRLKTELIMLLHRINEQLEEYNIHDTEKESTLFNITVENQQRYRNGKIIKGGKRFSFPKIISNELNLGNKSLLTVKVVDVKDLDVKK